MNTKFKIFLILFCVFSSLKSMAQPNRLDRLDRSNISLNLDRFYRENVHEQRMFQYQLSPQRYQAILEHHNQTTWVNEQLFEYLDDYLPLLPVDLRDNNMNLAMYIVYVPWNPDGTDHPAINFPKRRNHVFLPNPTDATSSREDFFANSIEYTLHNFDGSYNFVLGGSIDPQQLPDPLILASDMPNFLISEVDEETGENRYGTLYFVLFEPRFIFDIANIGDVQIEAVWGLNVLPIANPNSSERDLRDAIDLLAIVREEREEQRSMDIDCIDLHRNIRDFDNRPPLGLVAAESSPSLQYDEDFGADICSIKGLLSGSPIKGDVPFVTKYNAFVKDPVDMDPMYFEVKAKKANYSIRLDPPAGMKYNLTVYQAQTSGFYPLAMDDSETTWTLLAEGLPAGDGSLGKVLELANISDGILRIEVESENAYFDAIHSYMVTIEETVVQDQCTESLFDQGKTSYYFGDNQTNLKTLLPTNFGDKVQLEFEYFNTTLEDQLLSVYDGQSSASPLIGRYSGSNIPPTIVSSDPSGALTLHWIAKSNRTPRWKINKTCLSGYTSTVGCSTNYFDTGGQDGNYLSNENGTHIFSPTDPKLKVSLQFKEFDMEEGQDFVTVYNGPNTTFPILGKYSGSELPPILTSTHPSGKLTLTANSTSSIEKSGWEVRQSCVVGATEYISCSEVFYDSGGKNGNYSNYEDQVFTIFPENEGDIVMIQFQDFDVRGHDNLKIYDGPSIDDPLLGIYRGTRYTAFNHSTPSTVISTHSSGALTFHFASDGNGTFDGWKFYQFCVKGVKSCSQTINYTGGPTGNLNRNQNSAFVFIPDKKGEKVRLDLKDLNFFQSSNQRDKMRIYDGPSPTSPEIGAGYISKNLGPIISTHPTGRLMVDWAPVFGNVVRSSVTIVQSCVDNAKSATTQKNNSAGTEEIVPLGNLQLKIYPNPVETELQLEWDTRGKEMEGPVLWEIIDNSGKVAQSDHVENSGNTTLDMRELSVGFYILKLTMLDGETQLVTLIRQ